MGLLEDVGRRIAEIRIANGWTQEECAVRLEMTVRRLRRFEAGANVTLVTLERIATVLGVPARSLFDSPAGSPQTKRGRPRKAAPQVLPSYGRPQAPATDVLHERTVPRDRAKEDPQAKRDEPPKNDARAESDEPPTGGEEPPDDD